MLLVTGLAAGLLWRAHKRGNGAHRLERKLEHGAHKLARQSRKAAHALPAAAHKLQRTVERQLRH